MKREFLKWLSFDEDMINTIITEYRKSKGYKTKIAVLHKEASMILEINPVMTEIS